MIALLVAFTAMVAVLGAAETVLSRSPRLNARLNRWLVGSEPTRPVVAYTVREWRDRNPQ